MLCLYSSLWEVCLVLFWKKKKNDEVLMRTVFSLDSARLLSFLYSCCSKRTSAGMSEGAKCMQGTSLYLPAIWHPQHSRRSIAGGSAGLCTSVAVELGE